MASRIVLIHGFAQTGACWGPLPERLRSLGYDVATPDVAGFGGSSRPAGDLPTSARLLAEEFGSAIYLGYSFGGRIALRLAWDHPEVVAGLALLGATAGLEDPEERQARRLADEALADQIEADGVAAFIDRWLALPLFAGVPARFAYRTERLVNRAENLAASLRLAGTGAQEPLWGRLGGVAGNVLVAAGALDTKFATVALRLARELPAARTVFIPGAGHTAHLEQPDRFAAVVEAWLASL